MIEIKKSTFNGEISSPPSKSHAIRYVILSAFSKGVSFIKNLNSSEDIIDAINVLKASGINYRIDGNVIIIDSSGMVNFRELHVRGSATVLRIALAISAGFPGKKIITMGKSLVHRPMDPELIALKNGGIKIVKDNDRIVVDGNVKTYEFQIDGNISSQFITALMFLSPVTKNDVVIHLKTPVVSKTYLDITKNIFRDLGMVVEQDSSTVMVRYKDYKPILKTVPGDFTLSSYFAVMTGINGSRIRISNLEKTSSSDSKIVNILEEAGISSKIEKDSWLVEKDSDPENIHINMEDHPDLVPPVAALAAIVQKESILQNVKQLKYKESDRIEEIIKIIKRFGSYAFLDGSNLIIKYKEGRPFFYSCPNDHRMAMMAITLQSSISGQLEGEQCIKKSYPEFLKDFQKLGGRFNGT